MTEHASPNGPRRAQRSDSTSTRVTEQHALTTSSGAVWLLIGGLLALICAGFLFAMQWLHAPVTALVGFCIVVGAYIAMVVIRISVGPGRVRLWLLASLTLIIVIAFFTCGGIVMATEWNLGVQR